MLISFEIENFLSFKDPVKFVMTAGRERQHDDRIPKIEDLGLKILPVALVYGGNASGKSNFCKALRFVKNFIVQGRQKNAPIPVQCFKLDPECKDKPTRFEFALIINDECFEFGFIVNRELVLKEWLSQIFKSREIPLYNRENNTIKFHNKEHKKDEFLQFVFQSTRPNELFLTNSVNQNVGYFSHIFNWFSNNLTVISPDSKFLNIEAFRPGSELSLFLYNRLEELDTGISSLGFEEVPTNTLQLPEALFKENNSLDESQFVNPQLGYIISHDADKTRIEKLISYHTDIKGKRVPFGISSESDGTLRTMDLLPAFYRASKEPHVYVIDELDRSLHTLLTRELLEDYLLNCNHDTRSQMIFTTHDVLLMSQDLFRRDEMWLIERTNESASRMFSISDFEKVRNDKDIRRSYLSGRFGGIPNIVLSSLISDKTCE